LFQSDNKPVTRHPPQHPANPDADYSAAWIGWLSVAQLISWGSLFYTFTLIMGPVEEALGLNRVQSSLAFSIALLAEGLMAYPVGRWIDKGHERIVMTTGSVLAAICLLAHGLVTTLAGFYAVWLGLGIAMACTLYTPVFAVVTRRFPNEFRRAIITMTFLGGLASTVFIPLTAWLMGALGWRHALWCLAALHLLVCAPLHGRLLHHAPQPLHLVPGSAVPARSKVSDHVVSVPFLMVGAFVVLMMAVTVSLPAHMVSLLREHGLSEAWVIAIPASIGVIQVLGRLLLYFFERHLDLHLANRLIPALIPVGLLALLAAPQFPAAHVPLVLVFVLVWGMGNGMLTIVKGTAMAEYVNRDHVASLNGALGVPLALSRAGAPLGLGYLWSPQSGYSTGLWLLLAISVAGLGALTLAQRFSQQRQAATK
jgi:MFS family permease